MASKLADARALLGVTRDSTLEETRAIYKRKAMSAHPDKNNGSEASTIEFQQLSAAMHEIQKSHETPTSHCPCGRDHGDEDSGGEYEEYGDPDAFFSFMFESMFAGRGPPRGFFGGGGGGRPRFEAPPPRNQSRYEADPFANFGPNYGGREETSDEFRARKKKKREELAEQAKLSAAKEMADKENRRRKQQQDILEGEQRRDAKNAARKQKVLDDKAAALKQATDLVRKAQQNRSDAFQAARDNKPALVKKLVWEENVAASDVEFSAGFLALPTEPVISPPGSPPAPLSNGNGVNGGDKKKKKKKKGANVETPAVKVDSRETLLHLAAKNNDADLVAWLVDHGAAAEERDINGNTALHVALRRGFAPVVEYFLSLQEPIYPPPSNDSCEVDAFYPTPPKETLLSLAVASGSPETVALMVPYTTAEIAQDNWIWISEVMKGRGKTGEMENWEQMKWELAEVEGLVVESAYRRKRTQVR